MAVRMIRRITGEADHYEAILAGEDLSKVLPHQDAKTAAKMRKGRIILTDCLTKLAQHDVTNLLVEGGPTVLTSFFEQELVDEALVFTAPRLIGGSEAASAILGSATSHVEDALTPWTSSVHKVDQDILHHLRFRDPVALLG